MFSLQSITEVYESLDRRIVTKFEDPEKINGTTNDHKTIKVESADDYSTIYGVTVSMNYY